MISQYFMYFMAWFLMSDAAPISSGLEMIIKNTHWLYYHCTYKINRVPQKERNAMIYCAIVGT